MAAVVAARPLTRTSRPLRDPHPAPGTEPEPEPEPGWPLLATPVPAGSILLN